MSRQKQTHRWKNVRRHALKRKGCEKMSTFLWFVVADVPNVSVSSLLPTHLHQTPSPCALPPYWTADKPHGYSLWQVCRWTYLFCRLHPWTYINNTRQIRQGYEGDQGLQRRFRAAVPCFQEFFFFCPHSFRSSLEHVYNLVKPECMPFIFPHDIVVRHHFPPNVILTIMKLTKTNLKKNKNTNILATTIEPFL